MHRTRLQDGDHFGDRIFSPPMTTGATAWATGQASPPTTTTTEYCVVHTSRVGSVLQGRGGALAHSSEFPTEDDGFQRRVRWPCLPAHLHANHSSGVRAGCFARALQCRSWPADGTLEIRTSKLLADRQTQRDDFFFVRKGSLTAINPVGST